MPSADRELGANQAYSAVNMLPTPRSAMLGWDIWSAGRAGPEEITARQRGRLQELVSFARRRSHFYGELYRELPEPISEPSRLPPVSKTELMGHFDQWVTDSDVSLTSVKAFVAEPESVGRRYLDRYAVWKTSGTTGEPGLFLHDDEALTIYDLLFAIRGWAGLADVSHIYGLMAGGGRMACILATGSHFAGISSWLRLAREYPWFSGLMRHYSVMAPLDELVGELNDWRPAQLVAYPSVLSLLAREQSQGRLRIAPVAIFSSGECLRPGEREPIETAFGCSLRDVYACSEL